MDFINELKGFLTGILVRWVLKIAGAWFLAIGVEQGTVEQIVGGLVAILVGFVISLVQHDKAINTPAPNK